MLLFPVSHTAFSTAEDYPTDPGFDLGPLWARIERVQAPPSAPPIRLQSVKPSAQARRVHRQRMIARGAGNVGGITLCLLALAVLVAYPNIFVPLLVWLGWFVASEAWKWAPKELSIVETGAKSAQLRFDSALRAVEQVGDAFVNKHGELEEARRQLLGLADERQRAQERLKREAEKRQFERYLSRYPVARCRVRGIGSGRKQMLISYGIGTAADVRRRTVRSVPGFGSKLTSRMMVWRRSLERQFRFDPTQLLDPADVAQLEADLAKKRRNLQLTLRRGPSELDTIRRRATTARAHHLQEARAAANSAAQARADLRLFSS